MQVSQVKNKQVIGSRWAARERKGIPRALQRASLSPTATPSGSVTRAAAIYNRSAHASLNVKVDLQTGWRNLYSRVCMTVVPGAGLRRSVYSFRRLDFMIVLSWLTCVGLALVVFACMTWFAIQRMLIVG